VGRGQAQLGHTCANLQCSKELLYLREDRSDGFEFESDSDDQSPQDECAFAMKALAASFFGFVGSAREHVGEAMDNLRPRPGASQPKYGWQPPNLINPAVAATTQPLRRYQLSAIAADGEPVPRSALL